MKIELKSPTNKFSDLNQSIIEHQKWEDEIFSWLIENIEPIDRGENSNSPQRMFVGRFVYNIYSGKTGKWHYKGWNLAGFFDFEIEDDTQALFFKLRFG